MPLLDEAVPQPEAFQQQPCIRRDRLADLKTVVGPGFDDQDVVDAPVAERQGRRTAGDPAAEHDDPMHASTRWDGWNSLARA